MSLFSGVQQAPPDAILGLTEQFKADTNPQKVNLGVGVYQDASGKLPLLRCVEAAEKKLAEAAAAPGTVVVLHACCHNPTGYDLTADQWDQVIDTVLAGDLVAFLDMAYQGFSEGLEEDGATVRKFAERVPSFFVSTSFSKSLSLYGERVGALSIVCADAEEAKRVLSQVKIVIRTNYSNPPTHGAAIVETVLGDPELRAQWVAELGQMRDRIKQMRTALVAGLVAAGVEGREYITDQVGMFSFSGLTKEQMHRLRAEFAVYGTDTGRICVAALNDDNIAYVSESIAAVLQD